ncbi:ABC transporter permease [Paenibacillus eucommiae]|uniref:ABC-type antimicrobial peptide transport system permease subunit n=1 Tax=Paenibacillus eucommiae TaxID=1355755 RepID=A0ABS4INZ1_9BACL|nr:ABC transporter permease [Paenibacillus eucommiae]MBP1989273.1 ABC-type antimicrobial peptide transport system permease subunit [Paenibacillus eucommiae]
MRIKDYFGLGWDQINRRKVVTALCALGIAIGSASIIVALAFGESIQHYTQKQMSYYMKTDEIMIYEGDSGRAGDASGNQGSSYNSGRVTKEKLNLIRTLPHVKAVASFQNLQQLSFETEDGKKGYLDVMITELDTLAAFGSNFKQGYADGSENSIILNYGATMGVVDDKTRQIRSTLMQQNPSKDMSNTLNQLDSIPAPLYQKQIKLKQESFQQPGTVNAVQTNNLEISLRVTGVLQKDQGMPDFMVSNNKKAYVSPETGAKLLASYKDPYSGQSMLSYSEVKVKVDSSIHVKEVETMIQKLNLRTQSNLFQEDRMKNEFVIIRLLLTGVGLFVLFVASISIIVAMTMSTHQRRRQIGIMKVLGANLRQIRNMFIVESALLGFLGGLLGILLSYWVIWGINIVVIKFSSGMSGEDLEILFISLWILPVGMFFALLTGILSGLYPAVKASRTDALTAIKRE